MKPFSLRTRTDSSHVRPPPSPYALWHQNARCSPALGDCAASHARSSAARFAAASSRAVIFAFRDGARSQTIDRISAAFSPSVPPSHTCAM